MRLDTNHTRRTLLILCLIVASVLVVLSLRRTFEHSAARNEEFVAIGDNRSGHVTVRAAGRGKPYLNLRDGREMSVIYRGDQDAVAALRNRTARSRSLASADFDHNGTPDVVAGYGHTGGGLITLQRGNPDAFAPTDGTVSARLQQGHDPAALLPWADVYRIPVAPDFLVTGNFNSDSDKDVLVAAKDGALYLLAGDGHGRLGAPQAISLPGAVTALGAGQFRAADVFTDIAVGVSGSGGHSLLIFDDAATGFTKAVVQQPLARPATVIEFGGLDDDPFLDVAVAAGSELLIVHGWGRKAQVTAESRIEHINVGTAVRGLAVGEFAWDREGRNEIAALSDIGVHILQDATSDTRPFTAAEAARRTRGKVPPAALTRAVDIESLPSWQRGPADRWRTARWLPPSDCEDDGEGGCEGARYATVTPLLKKAHLSYRAMDDLMLIGGSQSTVEIVHSNGPIDYALSGPSAARDIPSTILDTDSVLVAVLALPRKLNGVTDVLMLSSASNELSVVPADPNTTITVDRTDDNAAASACTAAANDCSVRGAFTFANDSNNNNTTINIPAGTYTLSINGTSAVGCDGNATGDLGANQSMSVLGAGSATTIIRQTATGPSNDGDRVMCMNEPFMLNLIYNFSGVTFVGGRDGTAAGTGSAIGGGGIIGGEKGNVLTMTDVVLANNQVTVLGSGNLGGGGIQWTGGDLNITNSTIGGSSGPGTYTDRTSTTSANLQAGSGGGVTFTPSAPQHTAATGILTVAGSTFSRNTASGIGGAGADLLVFAFASPGGIGSGSATIGTSTFSNNQALSTASGGGIIVESLATTVATTSFTNNSAGNRGGGIYVAGAGLLLNGATPSITFSGNTAVNGGSSVSTAAATSVSGTNVTIGGDIEISTGGSWTNNTGSSLAPTNVVIVGGTLNMNNSTMHVGGNLSIGPGPVVGATFNANTGTVNLSGNFTFTSGGSGPATSFNAGTGTFNFNGTGAQSISNSASITFNNLTDSNVTQPLTLNNSLAVNGTLSVAGANAILSPVAAAVISGTGTLTGTGTARVSRIAATPDFLSQYSLTNKTLTNLTIDYNGAGAQLVNNTPAYSSLVISGSGTKTLQGNTTISGNLTINPSTLASGNFNVSLAGNWTNNGTFTPGTGTVTFAGTAGTQTLAGATTFFNLTLNNPGATTNFGATTTTIGNDLTATAGTMDGGTSTIIFTGVTDNAGSIGGAGPKNFHSLQISSPATISNIAGGNITIENNYTNAGTFTQAAALTTLFATDNNGDGVHNLAGGGTTTFGNVTINGGNTVDAGTHSFNVAGSTFTAAGAFTGNASTVTFNGAAPQTISGDGAKNFSGLLVNNGNGVQLANGTGAVDASVSGLLTLNTDLTVAAGAVVQQSGTSAGVADVLGTVRRTDLGVVARSFGNPNNAITINSGTPPTQLDLNLVKTSPATFPAGVKVVPRDIILSPTGGSGISATVTLRYIDPAELTGPGITESSLVLWKNIGGTWTPQGGTPDTAANFVSQTGISSFSEWAIAEASDLTLSKANNVSGSAVTGQAWNWTLTASNSGAPATFTSGQTILSDNLPNSDLTYGTPTVQNVSNVIGSDNISCSIVASDLTCTATGGSVTFDSHIGTSNFSVVFSATPQAAGAYQNPRTPGGAAQIDPANVILESSESNNSPTANTVTVGKANTTTTIASDDPDPSVVGQPVTVPWSVTVNAPGSLGAALTGTVTVSDGTDQCVAAVSAGQCDITFTSAGARSITATYAGDTNYNGSASTPATTHQVNKADTTTMITSADPDPSTPGQSVIVQWTVTVNAPGAGTPTGNVTVSDGVDSCDAPAATGQCTLALNTAGARTLTATYPGDTNFNTSDDTEDHQVCPSTLVTTAADSGAGSLRHIIAAACDGASITFDAAGVFATPQTIVLASGEMLIDKNLTITGPGATALTIDGNGSARIFSMAAGRTVAISGMTVTGGGPSTLSPGGGAIYNGGSTVTVSEMMFLTNTGQLGGAIFNHGDGTAAVMTVGSSAFVGNSAQAGGAILNGSANGGSSTLTILNSTISGNSASLAGGAVSNVGAGSSLTVVNATITNNRSDVDDSGDADHGGGGLDIAEGTSTVRNSILAGNFRGSAGGGSSGADDVQGTMGTASHNLLGPSDPRLAALADNGGGLPTHALLIDSPALDAGDNTVATDAGLTTDQRGFGRVRDAADADTTATVDIGAYEADPTLENIGNQSTLEDVQLVVNFRTGDDTIAFDSLTATSNDTTLVPNANLAIGGSDSNRTLTISPAGNMSGLTTITVTAQKTIGGTTQAIADTFDLTVNAVNDPPTIDPIADPLGIGEDAAVQTVNFSGVSAGGGETQTLVVTATSSNTTLIPNPVVTYTSADATGSLSYTPVPNGFGSAIITVTVNDGFATASQTFTVTVTAVNDAPTISAVANQTIDEDTSTGPIGFTIDDVDGLAGLSVTASSSDTTLVPDVNLVLGGAGANRTIDVTPAANLAGATVITLTVDDGTDSASTTFTVTVAPIDDPPTLDLIVDPAAILEDAGTQSIPLTGIGAGGNGETATLSVTALSSNPGVIPHPVVSYTSPNATGSISYTPVADANGSALITVTVSDGVQTAARSFTVTVTPVNDVPTIGVIANQTTAEDTAIGPLAFTIGDADGLAGLSVTASSSNTTLAPNANLLVGGTGSDRSITITPALHQSGSTTITLTVSDGMASAVSTFVLTVTPVADAPTITAIGDQALEPGESTGPLAFSIDDPEGLAGLVVTATSSNPSVIPNANVVLGGSGATRTVTVTATTNTGSTLITVSVSDGALSASTSFTVTVGQPEPPSNTPPHISAIADQSVPRGTSSIGPLTFTIGDNETAASELGVSATSGDDSIVPQNGIVLGGAEAVRTITLAIPDSANGSTEVTIAVSDGSASTLTSFQVAIEGPPVPAAPLDLRAVVQGRRVDLSWRMPAEDAAGDHAATGFRIEVGSASGRSDVATFTTGVTTTFAIADLAPAAYFMRVRGVNTAGLGNPSNEVQVIISGPPGPDAPQRLRATITGSTVQLDWEAPLDGLPVDGYQVEASYLINVTSIGVLNTLAPQLVAEGVGNGIYYARVRGIRGGAVTSASNEIVMIVGPDSCTAAPQPPAGIDLWATGNFAAARWLPPGGPQPVERYILSVGSSPGLSDRGAFEFSTATISVGAFVSAGTYVVRVAAANRCGTSVPTAEASITIGGPPPQLPGAPGGLTATVTGSTVRLDWAAPAKGSAPTRYIIELTTPGGAPIASLDTGNPSTTFSYKGTPAGVYVVRVRAANGAGAGDPSPPVVVTVEP